MPDSPRARPGYVAPESRSAVALVGLALIVAAAVLPPQLDPLRVAGFGVGIVVSYCAWWSVLRDAASRGDTRTWLVLFLLCAPQVLVLMAALLLSSIPPFRLLALGAAVLALGDVEVLLYHRFHRS